MSRRLLSGIALGALVAAGVAVAPALGAPDKAVRVARAAPTLSLGNFGTFTPAAADPRLAALLARGGLDTTGFQFTPSESRRTATHPVTVAVRARSSQAVVAAARAAEASAAPASVSLSPVAYNLGVAVGWRRFALSGDTAKVDLAGIPGSRESVDVGVSYTGTRLSGQLKAGADRPLPGASRLVEQGPAYSVDAAASYRLTHNLDVTAGVRYKAENDRLQQQATDNRHDSQAVYIGTAFRF